MRRFLVRVVVAGVAVLAALTAVGDAAGGDPAGGPERRPASEFGSSDWRTVSATYAHTCGIRTTGRLYCWGDDTNGQLGDGAGNTPRSTPTEVAGGHTDWTAVAVAGSSHTCARRSNGRLYCWGHDTGGQLGNGPVNTDQFVPVEVAGNSTAWTTVAAGGGTTCGRRSTGRLYCWGDDSSGQLGDGGANTNKSTPTQVAGGATDWATVSIGLGQVCGRRSTGRLYCWGDDDTGQLGDGFPDDEQAVPSQVSGNHTDWASVSAGSGHTCGRRLTGRLYCWGSNNSGELGVGTSFFAAYEPTEVAGNRTDWAAVSSGSEYSCARRNDGRLFCWGTESSGEMGDGVGLTIEQATPVEVAGGATDWKSFDAGERHTCARTTSKRLFCWGDDSAEELGNGPAFSGPQHEPFPVRA